MIYKHFTDRSSRSLVPHEKLGTPSVAYIAAKFEILCSVVSSSTYTALDFYSKTTVRMSSKSPVQVPIVDVSPLISGDLESRKNVARELAEKGHANGSTGITGHGLSPELLAEAFAVTKKLFNLPYEEKMKAPHPDGPTPHRGYSGTGRERAAAKTEAEDWENLKGEEKITDYKARGSPYPCVCAYWMDRRATK